MNDNIALLVKEFNAAGVSQFRIEERDYGLFVYDIQGINASARICEVLKALGMMHSFMHHYIKGGEGTSSLRVR